jgi:hypothetical protein
VSRLLETIEWVNGWYSLACDLRQSYLQGELEWELAGNHGHILAGRRYEAIGLCGVYDDLILRLDDRDEYAWIHLTWNRENRPAWPHCQLLGGLGALNRFLREWVSAELLLPPIPPEPDEDQ